MTSFGSPSVLLASTLFAVAVGMSVLGVLVVARRPAAGGRSFAVMMAATTVWSFAYAVEILEPSLEGKLFWARLEYLGVTAVPVAWFVFALQFARADAVPRSRWIVALSIIPLVTLVVALGPKPLNALLWPAAEIRVERSIPLLHLEHGPVFWLFTLYSYALVISGTILLARSLSGISETFRGQRLALVVGCAAPFLGSMAYVTGVSPVKSLSLAPFGFALSGAAIAWGLLRHQLLDIAPIARAALVESMEDFIMVIDAQGRIVDMNPALLAALDRPAEHAVGRPISDIFTDQADLIERYRGTLEERSEVSIAVRGVPRWFDLGISPIRDAEGALIGRLVVLRDVTARKQIADAFRESERKYRSILENIGEGYFELDLKGTIIHCNQVLANILGHPAEAMIGLSYRAYTDPVTGSWLKDIFIRIYNSGETLRNLNQKIIHSDGTPAHVELDAMPVVDESGATVGFRGLVRDVTERVKGEETLRAAQERISSLLEAASGSGDLAGWASTVAGEVAAAIHADRIGLWELNGSVLTALSEAAMEPPSIDSLRAAAGTGRSGGIQTDSGTIVPVTATTGEICGAVVVCGGAAIWDPTEQRIVLAFARQLGAALEMRRLRQQLATSEERRSARRREMKEQGMQLLRICRGCGRCYPDETVVCTADGLELEPARALPFRLADRYRFTSLLGTGGMGMVLSAMDEKLDREVAIKLLRPDHFNSDELRRRFEREARTVAQIQHPGVIALFDAGELEDGTTFLVVERLNGSDLSRTLARYGRGRNEQVASLVRQAGSAVRAAHRVGVVHRDIKPGNIFLMGDAASMRVTILDFGLAKAIGSVGDLTLSGAIVGTPAYMAPEQLDGDEVDPRADVYSLGCVAYEALLGRRVAQGENLGEIIVNVMRETPPRPSMLMPSLPAAIDALFDASLAKSPGARTSDIEAWGASLAELLESVPPGEGQGGWPAGPVGSPPGEGTEPTLARSHHTTQFW